MDSGPENDGCGLVAEAIRRACLAAALRKPRTPGMASDALRFRTAEQHSQAAARLITASVGRRLRQL